MGRSRNASLTLASQPQERDFLGSPTRLIAAPLALRGPGYLETKKFLFYKVQ